MTEVKRGSEVRKTSGFIDFLIAMRLSGEPFFGVQTVFARLIDKEIKKREARAAKEPPASSMEVEPIIYTIKHL